MSDDLTDALSSFAHGASLAEIWESARRFMLSKRRASIAENPLFQLGLERLKYHVIAGAPIDKLIAVDLLVRVPASIRKAQPVAKAYRSEVLAQPLPPLSIVFEKKGLPATAEPAEIRENVAKALDDADGEWVIDYAIQAFAEEDRSQRCRIALSRQIAKRLPVVEHWFEQILKQPVIRDFPEIEGSEASISRLRDIAVSLAETIREQRYRLSVSVQCGRLLSELARSLVRVGPRQALPRRLPEAGAAIVQLLDELLAVQLTLMDEPEIYEVLEPLRRWWSPAPYPKPVRDALTPIVDKLMAGIIFRARGGQQSERLVQRLRQALNDDRATKSKLSEIAEVEYGLSPDIQDWLLGIERRSTLDTAAASRLFSGISEEGFVAAIAPAFALAQEELALSTPSSQDRAHENHLASVVATIGRQYGLETVGAVGDEVEYSPSAHETVDGKAPKDRNVKVVRPMIIRRRSDGGRDVIVKGLVVSI